MTSSQRKRLLWRLANRAHDLIIESRSHSLPIVLRASNAFNTELRCVQRALANLERLHRSRLRLPDGLARRELTNLGYAINSTTHAAQTLQRATDHVRSLLAEPPPLVKQIYLDLLSLDNYFTGGIRLRTNPYDRALVHVISVLTDPISLENINFGPFEIRLDLLANNSLKVIALEPNTPDGYPNVTHPHVCNHEICLGEAKAPVYKAFADGRFFEAFVMINGVLNSYGEDPYVHLEYWDREHSVNCRNCGSRVRSEETFSCDECGISICECCCYSCIACGAALCSSCITHCSACGERWYCPDCLGNNLYHSGRYSAWLCEDCSETCNGCSETFPPTYIYHCKGCGELYCDNCLSSDGFCSICEEKGTPQDDNNQTADPQDNASCVGQAPNVDVSSRD